MFNKRGITLIELVVLFVCFGILIAVAVPKVLTFASETKGGAWKNSVTMIEKAIISNTGIIDPKTGKVKYQISDICEHPDLLRKMVKIVDTEVTCENNVFYLTGRQQFNGKNARIICENNKCRSVTD